MNGFISRGFTGRRRTPEELAACLPPGQYAEPGFPVLTAGATPSVLTSRRSFRVDGMVAQPQEWSWDELGALGLETVPCDIHCVTKWSKLGVTFGGVSVDTLLSQAQPMGEYAGAWSYVSLAQSLGADVAAVEVLADDRELLEERLRHWADAGGCELILTTGGTGSGPSDVTPEASAAVIERLAPGIAEAIRQASRAHTRHWMLSRAIAGIRGRTLIINFPGSPASIEQAGAAIADALPHALALLRGSEEAHA